MKSKHKRFIILALCLLLIAPASGEALSKKSSRRAVRSSARKSSRPSKGGRVTRSRNQTRLAHGKRHRRLIGRRNRRHRVRAANDDVVGSAPRLSPGIPTERVSEIQTALIKLGYLDGPASGQYDDQTIEAMKDFQADNKLAATGLPTAFTLKKLGVSKRSADGYAVPVKSVSESEKKRAGQAP